CFFLSTPIPPHPTLFPYTTLFRSTRVLANDLDLLAGHGIAVLLEVELDGVVHLRRRVGELAGVRHDEPDLDRRLSERRRDTEQHRGQSLRDPRCPDRCSPPESWWRRDATLSMSVGMAFPRAGFSGVVGLG